ncbi:hypothetical protein JDS87_22720 [Bacillus cereus]|uniref:hypothetical protein n=1 Tax=Bacillus cereus TaxID=1396 RepID=UPI0018F5B8AC|nr:hypothetical protein [Bacillus cereus]MBJ8054681.1 hypothetical protein [Bacillus cereus]
MDNLTIQGNTYDLQFIESMTGFERECTLEEFNKLSQFKKDIYTTYKQIRHICNPRSCEKLSLEKVKANLRDHWLEIYLNMTRKEAETVIEYAELFFGLAIK